jgi:hypothetical protein
VLEQDKPALEPGSAMFRRTRSSGAATGEGFGSYRLQVEGALWPWLLALVLAGGVAGGVWYYKKHHRGRRR